MNRILIGNSNNKIGVIKQDTIIIDIKENTNILIKDILFKKYLFNVYDAKLNVLIVNENKRDVNYEINIYKGNVSFNNLSYNSSDVKLDINLNKENSNILVYNSVISKKKQKYEISINHNKKLTNSNIYNNGVTKEDGSILFNVSSFVPKKSKDCVVNQNSKIITLNDTNDNEINPILLIDEFECEAKHAAFIGNFNQNELFYLMSRGLSKQEAMNLLINGLLIGTLDVCFNEKENLKKKLNDDWR